MNTFGPSSTGYLNFLALLHAHHVKYLVDGGYAVQFYGYYRPTRDLDIWISQELENARRLVETLHAIEIESPELTLELFQHKRRIIRIETAPSVIEILDPISGQKPAVLERFQVNPGHQIEILTVQSGLEFDTCFRDRIVDVIDGIPINFISLESLETIKRSTDRTKDVKTSRIWGPAPADIQFNSRRYKSATYQGLAENNILGDAISGGSRIRKYQSLE